MAYTPNNVNVYTAAYYGAIAGMAASGRILSDDSPANYSFIAIIAGTYAQSFDTAWGSAAANSLDLGVIQFGSQGVWESRYPNVKDIATFTPSTYTGIAEALIATVTASETYFSGQGITPPTPGGGGEPPWATWDPDTQTVSTSYSNWQNTSCNANGGGDTAIGSYCTASGGNSFAFGVNAKAFIPGSMAQSSAPSIQNNGILHQAVLNGETFDGTATLNPLITLPANGSFSVFVEVSAVDGNGVTKTETYFGYGTYSESGNTTHLAVISSSTSDSGITSDWALSMSCPGGTDIEFEYATGGDPDEDIRVTAVVRLIQSFSSST